MKNLWIIILVGGLWVGCEKKENGDAGKVGTVTPKPPSTQPEVVEKPNPSPPAKEPQPLPAELVAAWEKARFDAGWMRLHKEEGYFTFGPTLKKLDA